MEGYIKLTIAGEARGFKFDVKSTGLILKDLDVQISKIDQALQNPFFSYPVIVFNGAKRALEKAGEEVTFTQDDVYDWLEKEEDGVVSDKVVKIVLLFVDTITGYIPKGKEKAKKGQESPNVK